MFCKYCGKDLTGEQLRFCTNCGKALQEEFEQFKVQEEPTRDYIGDMTNKLKDVNIKEGTNSAIRLIRDSILKPQSAIIKFKNNLSTKATVLIYIISSIFISLCSVFLLSFLKDKFMNIMLFNEYGGMNVHERMTIKSTLDLVMPNLKVFMWTFLTIALVYLLIISLSYVIFTLILKKQLTFLDYMKGNAVAIIFHTIIILIMLIITILGFSFNIILILYMIFGAFTFGLFYECTASIVNDRNKTIYLYPITIIIAKGIALYILFNLVTSHFMSMSFLGSGNSFDLFNILDKFL